jgi:hypothetical protein
MFGKVIFGSFLGMCLVLVSAAQGMDGYEDITFCEDKMIISKTYIAREIEKQRSLTVYFQNEEYIGIIVNDTTRLRKLLDDPKDENLIGERLGNSYMFISPSEDTPFKTIAMWIERTQ